MNYEKTIQAELDRTLKKFYTGGSSIFMGHVKLNFQQPTGEQKVDTVLVEQCVKDGHLLEVTADGVPIPRYLISIEGLMLIERGGYVGQLKRERWQHRWTVSKTVATALYSLAILAVAVWAVYTDINKP